MMPRRTSLRIERLEPRENPSVHFRFDYSLDTSGFFNSPERKAALDQAGFALTSQLNDSLSAITPGGSNTWSISLTHPVTGQAITKTNLTIAADEIVVYAAGAAQTGNELGFTSPTKYTATGTASWIQTVQRRGENLGEVAPWGGMVTFGTSVNWSFSAGVPAKTQYDFHSVAQHELLHVLGFGAGNAGFERFVSGNLYVGPNVVAVAGGPVAVVGDSDHGNHPDHWAPGTTIFGATPIMAPDIGAGQQRIVTAIDLAAMADLGWSVDLVPSNFVPASSNNPDYGPPIGYTPDGVPIYSDHRDPSPVIPLTTNAAAGPMVVAVGANEGSPPIVTGYDAAGRVAFTKQVFESSVTGGVRVAVADFNADGTPDLVVGTGVGVTTRVRVINGKTGFDLFTIQPFESRFTGGVFVAAGDITGDGKADLAIAAGTGGGPRVRVFGGASLGQLADFFTIEDANFRGGVRPALADFTGDGRADLVVAAGIGGGPRVAAYNGVSLKANTVPEKIVADFFVGIPAFSDGAYLATGDTNGDGIPDLVTSAGPTVTVFDGKELGINKRITVNATFTPPTADSRSGARLAVADVSGDGKADVITFAAFRSTARQTAAYSPITKQLLGFEI